jgi:thiamine-monophosphate kinase
VPVARIGRFEDGPAEVRVLDAAGAPLALPRGGWSHF